MRSCLTPRRLRLRGSPTDAVSAYLRVLDEMEPIPATRRLIHETPRQHAARLRRSGDGSLPIDLLAADHQLVRERGRRIRASLRG